MRTQQTCIHFARIYIACALHAHPRTCYLWLLVRRPFDTLFAAASANNAANRVSRRYLARTAAPAPAPELTRRQRQSCGVRGGRQQCELSEREIGRRIERIERLERV